MEDTQRVYENETSTIWNYNPTPGFKRIDSRAENEKRIFKNLRKRLPVKMSSTNFLEVYVLYIMNVFDRPVFGYEILNAFYDNYPRASWAPVHSTLYTLLKKLVKDSLITVADDVSDIDSDNKAKNKSKSCNRYNKKYYTITPLGLETLREKLAELKPMIKNSAQFFQDIYKEMYGND